MLCIQSRHRVSSLRNQGGTDHNIRFEDHSKVLIPELKEIGLVTASVWGDFDGDAKLDLLLTEEWVPIRLFKNMGSSFSEISPQGLAV